MAVLALLLVITWGRGPEGASRSRTVAVGFTRLTLPPRAQLRAFLGPFELEAAWQLRSHWRWFGSYSALLARDSGRRLEALSDTGKFLAFIPPDRPGAVAKDGGRLQLGPHRQHDRKIFSDVESATQDPRTGQRWLGLEYTNAIVRLNRDWSFDGRSHPPSMAGWPENSGAEAMVRLADGRFLVLSEAFRSRWGGRLHSAVVFPGDPVARPDKGRMFTLDAPANFAPTDMAQLPDGRVLVLMRKVIWPMPQRFAGRIAIGDPRGIGPGTVWRLRTVARLASTLPVDNFEGMALVPRPDGRVTVWLISDDNQMIFQRTLLWKLVVDPAAL